MNNLVSRVADKVRQRRFHAHNALSSVSLETLVSGHTDLAIALPSWTVDLRAGNLFDGFVIAVLAKAKSPTTYFEIGTGHGRSAMFVAANTPGDTTMYTLDPQITINPHVGSVYRGRCGSKKIQELQGDSMTFDFSAYKNRIDLVFIDGSHTYNHVLQDTHTAFDLLAPDGWIVWHDVSYSHKEVMMALKQSPYTESIKQIANTCYAIYQSELEVKSS